MKIRMLMPVLAVLLVFGLANTAFAQLSCSVASTPVSRDTDTGHTEVVGDLIFNCTGGSTATTTATMTIDYGVTISNSTGFPSGKPIGIVNVNGNFSTVGQTPSIATVNNSTGQVVINIPGQTTPNSGTGLGSFTLTGVLASLNGSGKTNLIANVSVSPGNNVLIVAGQNNATVITSILPGILAPTLTPSTTAGTLLSSIPINPAPVGFSVRIRENYIDMYRSMAQYNSGFATNGVQLLLTFAGIPTGVSLGTCTTSVTNGTVSTTFASGSTITSANATVTIEFTGAGPSTTQVDDVTFACTQVTAGSTATIPLTPGAITMTATLAPVGSALGSGNQPIVTGSGALVPRYASSPLPSPPLTVINITAAQTILLIPFVVSESGFDTGIAIANTTTDPFGTTNGSRPQNGNLTFNIFPRTGSSCVVTPSTSTVGVGLTSAGILDSGRTYSVLLSELLKVTGSSCPTTMTGYIIAVANFPLGHGAAFVTNFGGFTSASNVLIMQPPATNPRNAITTESLSF
jgi:hypothetical protein